MAEVAIVLLVVFAVLLLINVPVAVAIGVASLVAVFANWGAVQQEMIVADRMNLYAVRLQFWFGECGCVKCRRIHDS